MSCHGRCGLEGPMLTLHVQPERFDASACTSLHPALARGGSRCCAPSGCVSMGVPAVVEDGAVRVICSNSSCPLSGLMHAVCFERWEADVLAYLRTCGGGASGRMMRGWTPRQRQQQLWTKRGLELAQRACACLCRRGYLRKHLPECGESTQLGVDFTSACVGGDEEAARRVKRRQLQRQSSVKTVLPALSIQTSTATAFARNRADSFGSAGSSPPSSGSEESPHSPLQQQHQRRAVTASSSASSCTAAGRKKNAVCLKNECVLDRLRHDSGNNQLFGRRADFSVFNILPRHKINSYHIKMEDEGSQGNDDTRSFLLSSLATARMSHTSCAVCACSLRVYDRYPIIDGTFFLSPRQHSRASVQVRYDGRLQYLSAVCMRCAEGEPLASVTLLCCGCRRPWSGSHLVLGTMYTYDVFAAVACCSTWLQCNLCEKSVIAGDQRLAFFSDYSNILSCPFCTTVAHHFVKPLSHYHHIHNSNSNNSNTFIATLEVGQ